MRLLRKEIFVVAALILSANFAAFAQKSTAPAPATAAQEQKNGTGIVPPGVKLVPTMPTASAARPFHFPQAASKTLSNGLRVFVVSDHSQPAIAAQLVILSAGSIKDPKDLPGVADMTANMLTQGTATRSARDIAEAIDFIGGSLMAEAGKDSTAVTLDIVKKDLQTGFDLMSDVVLHPAFKPDELARQQQQLLSGLTVQYSDPNYLASVVFARTVYGPSPYGWPSEGTPETVQKLDPAQLAKFHDSNYAPNQSLLAITGDITPDEAFAVAEKYFGAWPKQSEALGGCCGPNYTEPVKLVAPGASTPPAGMHVWLIDKPDAVQTQIRVGKLGIRRGDPNYIPVVVMNRIFGGGYNSRLNTEVRVKKGLTYGAYSSFSPHRYAGSFQVGTYTRTAATVEATKLVVDLIQKMSSGDVTTEEMNFARDYLAGVYPIQSETAEQVAERVLTVAAYDLPADYNSTYPERIRSVTSQKVEDEAKHYLQTNDLDLVLAGNVSAFRDELKKVFPDAKYEEIPYDQLDVLSDNLRKPAQNPAALTK